VVLRGLPFDEHDRLAVVLEHDTRRPETFGGVASLLASAVPAFRAASIDPLVTLRHE
jgi:hypothetical protein